MKKGQLTLFITIGIVLIFSVAIIIYLQQQIQTTGFKEDALSSLSDEAKPVKLFVDQCLNKVSVPGIFFMGVQGGYITPPLGSLYTENSIIPYYYNRGLNTMPSLTALENQIATYVETTLPACTDRFKQFSFTVDEKPIRATVRITEQAVLVKAFYPLTIKFPGREEKIENFVITVPVRLGHIYDVAQQVIQHQIKNPDLLDLTFMSSFDVSVNAIPFDGTTTVFGVSDRQSKTEGVTYQLFFANKYG